MHYFPLALDSSKQKGLVPLIVYFSAVPLDDSFDIDIDDRPRKIALDVRFDICEREIQTIQ